MAEVHFCQSNGTKLRSGDVRYTGDWPAVYMIAYAGGVVTTFRRDTFWYEVHWSNGTNLLSGDVRHSIKGPRLAAMVAYTNPSGTAGVLTAFIISREPRNHTIYWSPDGKNLIGNGDPAPYYAGSSQVTAMTVYPSPSGTGVLTAFYRRPTDPEEDHVVQRSEDGKNLGSGGAIEYYAGRSRVNWMLPYRGGVLTAFTRGENDYVVHRSEDGKNLGGGDAAKYYAGTAFVGEMIEFNGGVLTHFGSAGVHWSPNGEKLLSGDVRHPGPTGINCLIPYNGGVLTGFDA